MILLILFAFFAGIVTVLSPCILPILPIVLSSSLTGGKRKPFGIVLGFVSSFTFFTLFLSTIVQLTNIPADYVRYFAILTIFLFGLSLVTPQFQALVEQLFSKLSNSIRVNPNSEGFFAGILVGLSLGLLWTPCVGPILASVISLALTGEVTAAAAIITFAYALGTALPMFLIIYTGRGLFVKFPGLLAKTNLIQKMFGVVMIAMSVVLFFNIDRSFQMWILQRFPNYGVGLTQFEQNAAVQEQLEGLNGENSDDLSDMLGKPSFAMNDSYPAAPEFIAGGQWFNLSDGKTSLSLTELKGKVVLVDFWTYTCINCIRTLPYLNDWYQKYHDKGFEIVGVHSPEFAFEHAAKNVEAAIADFGIKFPVVQDNEFATWRAYGGNSWPRKYLIDKNGKIQYYHVGEGEYQETETVIRTLLEESGQSVADMPINTQTYEIESRTPEAYLGYLRTVGPASPESIKEDESTTFTHPKKLGSNEFSYSGNWFIADEYAQPEAGAELQFRYMSKNVFLVMRPVTEGKAGKVEIYLDDELVETLDGTDIVNGVITIDTDRLYNLIKLPTPGEHLLKIKFLDGNIQAFAFTFG